MASQSGIMFCERSTASTFRDHAPSIDNALRTKVQSEWTPQRMELLRIEAGLLPIICEPTS
jgi:hypothetical protein